MEFTGQAVNVSKDWNSNQFHITFSVNEEAAIIGGYDKVKSYNKLDIKVKPYKEKRSIDANNYLWLLLSKMAPVLKTNKDELYLLVLEKYGTFFYLPATDEDIENLKLVFRIVKKRGETTLTTPSGKVIMANQVQCYKGSSLYNTEEMSNLLDGVVSDAQELGIETMTPNQIEEMKQRWGIEIGNPK